MIEIKQIQIRQYTDKNGGLSSEVVGLGDDNNIYQWHRGTGKWILNIISN